MKENSQKSFHDHTVTAHKPDNTLQKYALHHRLSSLFNNILQLLVAAACQQHVLQLGQRFGAFLGVLCLLKRRADFP